MKPLIRRHPITRRLITLRPIRRTISRQQIQHRIIRELRPLRRGPRRRSQVIAGRQRKNMVDLHRRSLLLREPNRLTRIRIIQNTRQHSAASRILLKRHITQLLRQHVITRITTVVPQLSIRVITPRRPKYLPRIPLHPPPRHHRQLIQRTLSLRHLRSRNLRLHTPRRTHPTRKPILNPRHHHNCHPPKRSKRRSHPRIMRKQRQPNPNHHNRHHNDTPRPLTHQTLHIRHFRTPAPSQNQHQTWP